MKKKHVLLSPKYPNISNMASPLPCRCGFFVEKKKRFCKMIVAKGKVFCGEHANMVISRTHAD